MVEIGGFRDDFFSAEFIEKTSFVDDKKKTLGGIKMNKLLFQIVT